MDDIRAVMDAVGSERAAVMGESEGGPLAMLFAAAHPERTAALILQGAEVARAPRRGVAVGRVDQEELDDVHRGAPERWGQGLRLRVPRPSIGDAEWASRLARSRSALLRRRPARGRRSARWRSTSTCATWSRRSTCPTLIVHAADDRVCHVENARSRRGRSPGAVRRAARRRPRPLVRPGRRSLAEIREFLHGRASASASPTGCSRQCCSRTSSARPRARPSSATALARPARAAPRSRVARELARFDGARSTRRATGSSRRSTGRRARSGARRRSSTRCARSGSTCAPGCTRARSSSPTARSRGIAVNIGARVAAQADAGEVLVSGTVKDLVAGSGLEFEDRGSAALKGVPGEWRLFAVSSR